MAPVKFERQTNRHQRTHAITRIGALLQLPRPQRQFLAPRVRVHPFHQTTAAMERPADCNIRFTSGSPISCIVLRRVANLSVMTTTSTMKTKITNKTKTKTIAAICPIQVPIPSPPRQKPNEKKKTRKSSFFPLSTFAGLCTARQTLLSPLCVPSRSISNSSYIPIPDIYIRAVVTLS